MTAVYLDTHTAIVGASGAGKTVTAKGHVEALLDAGRHLCVLDPTGAWWGLRSDAAGTGPGYDIPIFGGPRGDVPISAEQGGAVGAIIAGGVSAIVDISDLRNGSDQRMFTRDLFQALRKKPNGTFHLVVDEADEFAAQKPRDDYGFQVGEELIWMAKRGRLAGFVLTLITQRPASIDKDVLTQAQTIFVHQLVAPVDQKPIVEYLRDHADKETLAKIRGSLASLERGERWVYSPRLKLLELGMSPMPVTFDSCSAPAAGSEMVAPKMLAGIDLAEIRKALAPAAEMPTIPTSVDENPECAGCAAHRARLEDLEAERDEWTIERAFGQQQLDDALNANRLLRETLENVLVRVSHEARGIAHLAETQAEQLHSPGDTESVAAPASSSNQGEPDEVAIPRVERAPQPEKLPRSTSEPSALNASARKMLEMLEQIAPAGVPWGSLAAMVGNKARGGNFNAARKALRESGLIIEDDNTVRSAKLAHKGMTRTEAFSLWESVLSNPAPRMLRALGVRAMSRMELGAFLGIAPRGGNFNSGVAQLIRNGVAIDVGGVLRLANPLPGENLTPAPIAEGR